MMWNKTITIYNRHEDEQTGFIKWYRHIIENCFYKTTNNQINVGSVLLNSDDTIIRIPSQSNYKTSFDWNNIPNDKKNEYLTIKKGDLILLGEVTEDIDEYITGKRSNDIIEKYSLLGAITINSINDNDSGPLAHYLIRGK